jgi:hypothetical protein
MSHHGCFGTWDADCPECEKCDELEYCLKKQEKIIRSRDRS